MVVKVGSPAPDFTLPRDGNLTLSLSQLKGKNIILYFYPKDDTPGCTLESCGFRDSYKDFQKFNTEIIGVSKDSVESHNKFKDKYSLPFPLVSDKDGNLCETFDVWKEKSMYGKKYMGIERSTFLIDAQGVLHEIWRGVKVPGHIEEVLQTVKKL
jgi:peroxiredoxin Q/BCP